MSPQFQITASIVVYKNNPEILQKTIASFLNTSLNILLYVIDNSPTPELQGQCLDKRIQYIFNNKNLGFGKAHNIAFQKAITDSEYHLILNPDIYFDPGTLEKILEYMNSNKDVGQLMPLIVYPNNEIQYLCKMLPTPADLLLRRFFPGNKKAIERNNMYELRDSGYNQVMNIPYLSGCFMFIRTSVLKEVGLFDERIFMYIEDTDLTRRIHQRYRTIFFPLAKVYHHYAKGSYKSLKLMFFNIHGAVIYFTKWGWFFDRERDKINQIVKEQYLKK